MASYYFDKVVEGTPVVHDFAITNTETTNWVVTSAETSCECVSVCGRRRGRDAILAVDNGISLLFSPGWKMRCECRFETLMIRT
jgi:hypothetical protein